MLRNILVPLDGSSSSEHALPEALNLAHRSGATPHLALVHVPIVSAYADGMPIVDKTLDAHSRQAELAYLHAVQTRLVDKRDLPMVSRLLEGPAANTLARYVEAHRVDLVVMTTHGHGGLARFWLGSVADKLTRQSQAPILFLRAAEAAPGFDRPRICNRIMIALDGSAVAEQIIEPAITLGTLMHAQYTLLQVVEPAM